jgi:hypothetical protein
MTSNIAVSSTSIAILAYVDRHVAVKYSRQNSIHFSPTVLWDGLIVPEVSSSWGQQEWESFFEKRIPVGGQSAQRL